MSTVCDKSIQWTIPQFYSIFLCTLRATPLKSILSPVLLRGKRKQLPSHYSGTPFTEYIFSFVFRSILFVQRYKWQFQNRISRPNIVIFFSFRTPHIPQDRNIEVGVCYDFWGVRKSYYSVMDDMR